MTWPRWSGRALRQALILLGLLLLGSSAAAQVPDRPRHVEARLVAETGAIVPGTPVKLGIRQVIESGWHTYWRNPGDSGEALHLDWRLPAGFTAGELSWPAPKRLPVGPLLNFGYETRVMPLVTLQVPKDLKPGTEVTLSAAASWLVCAEICVPEEGMLSLTLPVRDMAEADPIWAADFMNAREALPQPFEGSVEFDRDRSRLRITLKEQGLSDNISSAAFFPFEPHLIVNAAAQEITTAPGVLVLGLAAGRSFTEPGFTPPSVIDGVVTFQDKAGTRRAFAVSAQEVLGASPAAPAPSFALALVFALFGGLILNLMPCVLPVLAMKAGMVVSQAHRDARAARAQGWAYGAGVVASFLAIAGLLIGLRAGGAEIGWGFQFQSPLIVALMALFFLAIALNFLGLFEVAILQGVGPARSGGGTGGAFLTGVLAVAAASPCTAPFMAAAIGAALIAPPATALAIFAGLGLGMAAPFVLLSEVPGLLAHVPKPGPWMLHLKRWLALPMAATALWLGWVLAQSAGIDALGWLLLGAAGLALVLWMEGRRQTGQSRGARAAGLAGLVALSAGLGAIIVLEAPKTGPKDTAEAYSADRLAALQAAGQPVFIDLTAAWCITCKVNETLVLSNARVKAAFRDRGVIYLRGDWTRRDPAIARLLAAYGRNGVPLYLYFAPGAARGLVLPQILTADGLIGVLADGARRGSPSAAK